MSRLRLRLPGYRVVQLGKWGGSSPIGVLERLAADDQFRGIVICDTLEPFLIKKYWQDQRDFYAAHLTWLAKLDAALSAIVEDQLAVRSAVTSLSSGLQQSVNLGHAGTLDYVRIRRDRTIELDFDRVTDLPGLRKEGLADAALLYEAALHPAPAEFDSDLHELDQLVRRIQSRGGEVLFLRMPSTGARLDLEDRYYPKTRYWDRFATICGGRWIHFQDLSQQTQFDCPDESHLDRLGAVQFTDLLAATLIERQLVVNASR